MPDQTPRAITVPRPHVLHGPDYLTAEEADASYLRAAAGNIRHARCLGSNLTNTVTQLLLDAATAIESAPPARSDASAGTAQHLAHQITDDVVGRHEAAGHDTADLDRNLIDAAVLDGFLGALAVTLDRDAIRKAISDAYYDSRNTGGTMETAADRAADAVLEVIRG